MPLPYDPTTDPYRRQIGAFYGGANESNAAVALSGIPSVSPDQVNRDAANPHLLDSQPAYMTGQQYDEARRLRDSNNAAANRTAATVDIYRRLR